MDLVHIDLEHMEEDVVQGASHNMNEEVFCVVDE